MWQALQVINSVLNPRGSELLKDFLLNNVFMFCVDEVDNDLEMSRQFGSKKIKFDGGSLVRCFTKCKQEGVYFADFTYGSVIYGVSEQKHKILQVIKEAEFRYSHALANGTDLRDYPAIITSTPQNDYSGNHSVLYREYDQWKKRFQFELEEIESQSTMWTYVANEFYRIAAFIKKPAYSLEKEHRFVFYRAKDNNFYDTTKKRQIHCLAIKPGLFTRI